MHSTLQHRDKDGGGSATNLIGDELFDLLCTAEVFGDLVAYTLLDLRVLLICTSTTTVSGVRGRSAQCTKHGLEKTMRKRVHALFIFHRPRVTW